MEVYRNRKQILNSLVECPECHATRGQSCLNERGLPRKQLHWPKVATWQQADPRVQFPKSAEEETILRVVNDEDDHDES